MIRLTVKDGSIVQTLTLDEKKVFIGRLESNTIRLTSQSVSRKHGLIRWSEQGHLEILDLNSSHGIRRNGKTVDRAPLVVGDVIELGEAKIRIEELEGTPKELHLLKESEDEKKPVAPPARESKVLISQTHRTSFNEYLFRQLRRTPWWAGSVFIHVLLVYIFLLVPFAPEDGSSPFGTVDGKLGEDFSGLIDDSVLAPEDLLDSMAQDPDDIPDPTIEEDPPLAADQMEAFRDETPLRPVLGPSAADFNSRITAKDLSTALSIPDAAFGQSGAEGANRKAVRFLQDSLRGRGGPGSLGALRRLTARELLVVEGHYDKVESILDLLSVRYQHTSVRRMERTDLGGRKLLLINCTNEAPSRATLKRIKRFVQSGGYLLTTDWGLENVLKKGFEGYVRPVTRNSRNVITPNEVIGIHAVPEQRSHFLLAGTLLGQGEAKWWLEESSYPIEIIKRSKVDVLIESDDLERKYGSRPVAVTFKVGKGRVLHMLGHFFQKEGNLKGAFSTQRLIANFLLSAIRKK